MNAIKTFIVNHRHVLIALWALLIVVLGSYGLKVSIDGRKASESAHQTSVENQARIDRNYRRWDEFARRNQHLDVPPHNGDHP